MVVEIPGVWSSLKTNAPFSIIRLGTSLFIFVRFVGDYIVAWAGTSTELRRCFFIKHVLNLVCIIVYSI